MNMQLREVQTAPKTRFVYIMRKEDHGCIGSNFYGTCGLNHLNKWPWIVGHMIDEFGCNPDDVHCVETDDGEAITVGGEQVAYLIEE